MDRRGYLTALAIIALAIVAHAPATDGGFIWDDDDYVSRNETLEDLAGLGRIWFELGAVPQYYPLVHTTFWIEYRLWGLDPLGYHVTNVLLHALASLLLWRVLRILAPAIALPTAAVFAVHPVLVESVAWITERKNTLSGVFYLGAALAYLRFSPVTNRRESSRRGLLYALSLVLFVAALLSKTVTASLPMALALVLVWKAGSPRLRDGLSLLPHLVLGVGLGMLTVWMERSHVGAEGPEWALTAVERILIAGRAFWFYIAKLLLPTGLTFVYPRWEVDAGAAWQYLYPGAAVALIAALWSWRKRFGGGPLVAVLYFGGTLVPALGFFNVYPMRFTFVADHYQYLASIGVLSLAIAIGAGARRRPGPWRSPCSRGPAGGALSPTQASPARGRRSP